MADNTSPLSPQDEFQNWLSYVANVNRYAQQHNGDIPPGTDIATYRGDLLSPAAQALKNQWPSGQYLDTASTSPGFKDQPSVWSHPETWLQLGLGAAVAAPALIGALGGAGASGAGSGAASSVSPAATGGLSGVSMGMPSALPGALSSVPALDASSAFVGPTLAQAAGTGAAAGGFDWSKLIAPLIGAGVGTLGRVAGSNATTSAVPPALTTLLNMAAQRAQYQNPLFQAVTNQAYAGLPNYAKTGLTPPTGTITG